MASLKDGLGGEELAQSGLQAGATNISPYFTGSVTAEGGLVNSNGNLQSTAVGTTYGAYVQTGSAALGAGSTVSVTFGNTFTGVPHVVCSYVDEPSSVGVVTGSNVKTTGFGAIGDTASKSFNWIAIGV